MQFSNEMQAVYTEKKTRDWEVNKIYFISKNQMQHVSETVYRGASKLLEDAFSMLIYPRADGQSSVKTASLRLEEVIKM